MNLSYPLAWFQKYVASKNGRPGLCEILTSESSNKKSKIYDNKQESHIYLILFLAEKNIENTNRKIYDEKS